MLFFNRRINHLVIRKKIPNECALSNSEIERAITISEHMKIHYTYSAARYLSDPKNLTLLQHHIIDLLRLRIDKIMKNIEAPSKKQNKGRTMVRRITPTGIIRELAITHRLVNRLSEKDLYNHRSVITMVTEETEKTPKYEKSESCNIIYDEIDNYEKLAGRYRLDRAW